jgi:hypothetical protein
MMELFYEYYFYVTIAAAVGTAIAKATKTKKDDVIMIKINTILASISGIFKPTK